LTSGKQTAEDDRRRSWRGNAARDEILAGYVPMIEARRA